MSRLSEVRPSCSSLEPARPTVLNITCKALCNKTAACKNHGSKGRLSSERIPQSCWTSQRLPKGSARLPGPEQFPGPPRRTTFLKATLRLSCRGRCLSSCTVCSARCRLLLRRTCTGQCCCCWGVEQVYLQQQGANSVRPHPAQHSPELQGPRFLDVTSYPPFAHRGSSKARFLSFLWSLVQLRRSTPNPKG